MAAASTPSWTGDYGYLLQNLLLKDFRVRYRNMSLGFGWSVASPLIMMGVLTFIFTQIFPNNAIKNFPAFALCGLVPFNFFSLSWATGTASLVDNGPLIKRTRFPREIVPISSVLANCLHFAIQIGLLLVIVLWSGYQPSWVWLWLPVVVAFEIVFVCGLSLAFSALDVYIRDMRYLVESANTIHFWLVPVFYDFSVIPERFNEVYRFNPVAAVIMAFRNILIEGKAPAGSLLWRLALVSTLSLAIGIWVFRKLRRRLFDFL